MKHFIFLCVFFVPIHSTQVAPPDGSFSNGLQLTQGLDSTQHNEQIQSNVVGAVTDTSTSNGNVPVQVGDNNNNVNGNDKPVGFTYFSNNKYLTEDMHGKINGEVMSLQWKIKDYARNIKQSKLLTDLQQKLLSFRNEIITYAANLKNDFEVSKNLIISKTLDIIDSILDTIERKKEEIVGMAKAGSLKVANEVKDKKEKVAIALKTTNEKVKYALADAGNQIRDFSNGVKDIGKSFEGETVGYFTHVKETADTAKGKVVEHKFHYRTEKIGTPKAGAPDLPSVKADSPPVVVDVSSIKAPVHDESSDTPLPDTSSGHEINVEHE